MCKCISKTFVQVTFKVLTVVKAIITTAVKDYRYEKNNLSRLDFSVEQRSYFNRYNAVA